MAHDPTVEWDSVLSQQLLELGILFGDGLVFPTGFGIELFQLENLLLQCFDVDFFPLPMSPAQSCQPDRSILYYVHYRVQS